MKIFLVCPPLLGGGATKATLSMINSISKDHLIYIATHISDEILDKYKIGHNVRIVDFGRSINRYRYFLYISKQLENNIASIEKFFDYLWIQSWDGYCFKIPERLRTPIIITFHDRPDYKRFNKELFFPLSFLDYVTQLTRIKLNKNMINSKHQVIFHGLSTFVINGIKKLYQVANDKNFPYFILPNGISAIRNSNQINLSRSENLRKPLIITSGYLPRKGIHRIIEELGRTSIYPVSNLTLVIYGNSNSIIGKSYVRYLHSLISTYNLENTVYFLSYITEAQKLKLLKQADYYWEASYSEAHSLSPIEASLFQNRIITTGVGGTSEFSRNHILFKFDGKEHIFDLLLKQPKPTVFNIPNWIDWGKLFIQNISNIQPNIKY